MPTNRSNWRTGTTRRNSSSSYSSGRRTGTTGFWNSNTNSSNTGSWGTTNINSYSSTKFSSCRETITAKIGSLRAINQQFTGAGKVTAFSPTNAGKWINMVNDGANVYTFSNSDFCRNFGRQLNTATPTFAFRWLKNKFGTGIKAVTRGKSGNWLVCATPRVSGRAFTSYNWK